MHDFAATQNYVIFIDHPVLFDTKRLVKERKVPFVYRKDLPCRFGLLPTSASSGEDIRWFDLPPHAVVHVGNAWEADGKVVMYACSYKDFSLDLDEPSKREGGNWEEVRGMGWRASWPLKQVAVFQWEVSCLCVG